MELPQAPSRKTSHKKSLPQQEPKPSDPKGTAPPDMQTLAYLRIWQILGDKKANPPVAPLLPISRSSFYSGIKSRKYPAPVRLSARVSAWRVEDIRKLLESMGREGAE
jgi:predicted DNA-binding transcriptional regulator AlpA